MSLPELRPQPWMEEGRCRAVPPDTFFPEQANQHTLAMPRWICARCPVQEPCRTYAVDHHIAFGVWAGTTPREREAIRRRRGAA